MEKREAPSAVESGGGGGVGGGSRGREEGDVAVTLTSLFCKINRTVSRSFVSMACSPMRILR